MTNAHPQLASAHWHRLAYAPALDRQRLWNEQIQQGERSETVVFVEHDPVITISRRPEARNHLVASEEALVNAGITVVETDRGGDITYHGPGQLVAYPMVRLKPMGLGVAEYMRFLETVVIETLAAFAVTGQRVEGKTGVWVEAQQAGAKPEARFAKLCAMGVRVRRGVTMHGLALNVSPDLSHFQTIVPCGLPDPVTSLQAVFDEAVPSMASVEQRMFDVFARLRAQRLAETAATRNPD
ncbi:MAG: lipoyl(octanoyl) transferase LipB [Pseudomonadota bacterium]